MEWQEYIVADKNVLLGKPTIRGTRISIEFIVQLLASGWTETQILENYPRLEQKHLQAVFSYLYDGIRDNLMYNNVLQVA